MKRSIKITRTEAQFLLQIMDKIMEEEAPAIGFIELEDIYKATLVEMAAHWRSLKWRKISKTLSIGPSQFLALLYLLENSQTTKTSSTNLVAFSMLRNVYNRLHKEYIRPLQLQKGP